MLPLARPELSCPLLQRDGPDGRPILVANHFAPSASVRRADLRGTFSNAQQTLAIGSKAGNSSPILSTTCTTTHSCSSPPDAMQSRPPCPGIGRQLGIGTCSFKKLRSEARKMLQPSTSNRASTPSRVPASLDNATQPETSSGIASMPSYRDEFVRSRRRRANSGGGTGQGNGGSTCWRAADSSPQPLHDLDDEIVAFSRRDGE
jgi:hypothetical protein